MTPELIGILAVGATLAGLMVAIWRDARAHTNQGLAELRIEIREQRTETRSEIQSLRAEVRADFAQVRADIQVFRQEVRADLTEIKTDVADLRTDVQTLTERLSRTEVVIEGLFAGRDRHNAAA